MAGDEPADETRTPPESGEDEVPRVSDLRPAIRGDGVMAGVGIEVVGTTGGGVETVKDRMSKSRGFGVMSSEVTVGTTVAGVGVGTGAEAVTGIEIGAGGAAGAGAGA